MTVLHRLRDFWRDVEAAHAYIRDPHGWWSRRRQAEQLRFLPRPGMFKMGNDLVVHPALETRLRRELVPLDPLLSRWGLFGVHLYVSMHALELPPKDGWPDVVVPELPRFAP